MVKYFLGANSSEGFISNFQKCYIPIDGWKAYIIKGGPGTGKSSFMKKLAEIGENRGVTVEYCPCSSDPDSLDGIIFPDLRVAVMDGTSPHTVDPIYPGLVDSILNFGDFWDNDKLKSKEIIKLTDNNKSLHKTASLYIKNAGLLKRKNGEIISDFIDNKKLDLYCEKMFSKYLKGIGKGYSLKEYFISGISPSGFIYYYNTIIKQSNNTVIFNDEYGSITKIIYEKIISKCKEKSYEVIAFKNYLVNDYYDGLFIPELKLGFINDSKALPLKSQERRVHITRFLNGDIKRNQIKFNNKIIDILLSKAVKTLEEAKSVHDDLENIYIKAMNYQKLDEFTNTFAEKLFYVT